MSERPVTGEGTPLTYSAPSNPNGIASNVAIGGTTINPPKPDINPAPHLPTVTVPHSLLPATSVNPPLQQQAQPEGNDPPKIPPLMAIRPNISSLPPPPPSQLPHLPPAAQFPSTALLRAALPTTYPIPPAGNPVLGGPVPSPSKVPPKTHTPDAQGKKPTSVSTGALHQGAPGPGKQMKGKEEDGYVTVHVSLCMSDDVHVCTLMVRIMNTTPSFTLIWI